MLENKYILIIFAVALTTSACDAPPPPELPVRDATLLNDMANTGPDMELAEDIGTLMDGTMPDAGSPPLDSTVNQDAQTPPVETGRLQCGALTYSVLNEITGNLAAGWRYTGQTELGNGYAGSCGGLGSEAVIEFTAPQAGIYTLHLTTTAGSSPVLYVRETCADESSEAACSLSSAQFDRATVSISASAGSTWYIFSDTWQPSSPIEYTLAIYHASDQSPPTIESSALSVDTGELRLKLLASDINGNIVSGLLESMSDGGQSVHPFNFDHPDTDDTLRYADFNFGAIDMNLSSWRLTVTDQTGLDSEPVMLDASVTQNGMNGDLCAESTAEIMVCDDDSGCNRNADGVWTCTEWQAPQIMDFEVYETQSGHTALARISDPNFDTAFGLVELNDSDNNRLERHLFPIDQNELSGMFRFKLPRQVSDAVQFGRLTLTDEAGLETISSRAEVQTPEIAPMSAACNRLDLSQRCMQADVCLRACETDLPECEPACVPRILPSVESAALVRNTARNILTVSITIEDPQRIFDTVTMQTDEDPVTQVVIPLNGWTRVSDSGYETKATVSITDALRALTSIIITPLDQIGGSGVPYRVEVQDPETIDSGALCDPLDAAKNCPSGEACFATEGEIPICGTSQPPQLNQATLYTDPEFAYAGIRIIGQAGDADARVLFIRTLDNGVLTGVAYSVPLDTPIAAQSMLNVSQRLPTVAENLDVEVALQDDRYLQSTWRVMERMTPSQIALDETCELDEIFGRCSDDSQCLPTPGSGHTCQAVANTCADEWQVQSLEEVPTITFFNGDSREGYTNHTGACNLGGQGIVHGFIARESRLYVARVSSIMPSPIRYPRLAVFGTCGAPLSEISCSQTSSVAFHGEAGSDVFITVSAPPLGLDFQGTYAMEVEPHRPSAIRNLSIPEPVVLEQLNLNLEFAMGSEPVTSISIRILDTQGNPLWSPVFGEIWTQSLVSTASENGYSASSLLALSSFDEQHVSQIEIRLIDALDIYSEPVTVFIQ